LIKERDKIIFERDKSISQLKIQVTEKEEALKKKKIGEKFEDNPSYKLNEISQLQTELQKSKKEIERLNEEIKKLNEDIISAEFKKSIFNWIDFKKCKSK